MSEKEKQAAVVIAEAYAQMSEGQKQYFLGYAQATADIARQTREQDPGEQEPEDRPA